MTLSRLLFLVALVLIGTVCQAQRKSPELMAVEMRLVRAFEESKPSWTHKEVAPIQGSGDVAIHRWTSNEFSVRITITRSQSVESAQTTIRRFVEEKRGARIIQEDADEAYSVPDNINSVVVRKANLLIYFYVSGNNPKDEDVVFAEVSKLAIKTISAELARLNDPAAVPPRPDPPEFQGTSIPYPPEQNTPWAEPRIHLPVNLISATARLFDQGLADPRGLEYREIEIDLGRLWGRRFITKTHGWILPGAIGTQRFAVCWNGLVYPIVSIGNEADLHLDVDNAIKSDEEVRAKRASDSSMPFFRIQGALPESYSLSATNLLPIRVCLLLRLGKTDLAERVWATWTVGAEQRLLPDPYLVLAFDWLWAMYDRAINAHMRGDDRMCRISALMSEAMEKSVSQEIPNRPLLRGQPFAQDYLNCLKPLPLLIQDQERRAKHPRPTPVPRDAATLRQQTIAQLIDYLDEAFAVATSIPGGVDMSQDAVVEELIRRGKASVEPLLNTLENDTRLTRSVESSRPWHYDRQFITVYKTALQTLRRILSVGNGSFEDWDNVEKGLDGRRIVAARLRTLAQRE